jgi:hypothetical protein
MLHLQSLNVPRLKYKFKELISGDFTNVDIISGLQNHKRSDLHFTASHAGKTRNQLISGFSSTIKESADMGS